MPQRQAFTLLLKIVLLLLSLAQAFDIIVGFAVLHTFRPGDSIGGLWERLVPGFNWSCLAVGHALLILSFPFAQIATPQSEQARGRREWKILLVVALALWGTVGVILCLGGMQSVQKDSLTYPNLLFLDSLGLLSVLGGTAFWASRSGLKQAAGYAATAFGCTLLGLLLLLPGLSQNVAQLVGTFSFATFGLIRTVNLVNLLGSWDFTQQDQEQLSEPSL